MAHQGYECKVVIGTYEISLMGQWNMSGVTTDMQETTAFGDDWKQFVPGQRDGGTITFSGLYDSTDTNGQTAIRTLNVNNTSTNGIKLYVDNTSYWTFDTTGNPGSCGWVTDWSVAADKSSLLTADFTIKVSGSMTLV